MTQTDPTADSALPDSLDAALRTALGRSGTGAPAEAALTELERRKAEGLRGALIRRSGLSDREALDAISTIALTTLKLERLDRLELECLDRMAQSVEAIIAERRTAPPDASYTARLLAAGPERIAQKVGEEGVELALAGASGDRTRIVSEAADLLYHTLVLLAARDVRFADVLAELERRHRP